MTKTMIRVKNTPTKKQACRRAVSGVCISDDELFQEEFPKIGTVRFPGKFKIGNVVFIEDLHRVDS